ncbi:predicted permease [Aeropyrum camini SY1 = JCM 12091]|uniref:Probable membrane transporter protein n=1 Tax=Aeropyrum camini SY1 = JCM 12091 TaxID=1198449 RepID=U3TCS2_9CREN|nr:predicted permease [Aeropyrum camini SY1 = JCM 12091]
MTASALDYGLGLGFGLIATPMLVILDLDPRQAIAVTLSAQVFSSLSALYAWRSTGTEGPPKQIIIVLAISALAGVVWGSLLMSLLEEEEALALYTAALVVVTAFFIVPMLDKSREGAGGPSRPYVLVLGGFVGGLSKALSGGGFSPIVVAAQRASGIDYRASLVAIPIIKPLAFITAAAVYSWAGHMNLTTAAVLTAGSILGSLLAPKLPGIMPIRWAQVLVVLALLAPKLPGIMPIRWAQVLVVLALAAAALKAVYRLSSEYGVFSWLGL